MRQRPAGRHVVAPAEEELVAAGHALGGVNVAGDGAGVLRLGVGAAGHHVVAGALGTIGGDDVVAGRALRIGDVVGPGVGVGVADRLRAAGQGVVAVASDDGVVAGLGAVVAGRVVGVGVGVVGDIQRVAGTQVVAFARSEEHTSELQSLMRISYAVFCLKKKTKQQQNNNYHPSTITATNSNKTVEDENNHT